MKILVVDDEILVARYISKCIEDAVPSYTVLGAVTSGAKALTVIQENLPDIVFTDITMPKMDGLELLRILKEQYPSITVVVLTCHEEFTYARQAMRNRADDYILKSEINPVYIRGKLEEIVASLQERRKREASAVATGRRDTPENRGIRIITKQALREPSLLLREDAFVTMAFLNVPQNMEEVAREVSTAFENCLLYRYSGYVNVLLCNLRHSEECSTIEKKEEQIDLFIRRSSERINGPLTRSRLYYRLARISQAIDEAVGSMDGAFYDGLPSSQGKSEAQEVNMQNMMVEIASKIGDGDTAACCTAVENLMDYVEQNRPPLGALLGVVHHMSTLCSYPKAENGETEAVSWELSSFQALRTQIRQRLSEFQANARPFSKTIEKAVCYIKEHYREDLTLELVAEHVFLNREYFSRQFKKEVGMNFSEYLMKLRLREAKRLLQTTSMRIGEIAGWVGIPNVSYFTVAFKKQYSVLPSEVRTKR